ncbi:ras-related protein Rab-23-like [Amphibalanus amphitrite]|uniref:ras-related protein Rab-23-like n=1 Tax=Amphibalanus amphitrite TaxID=1232801 RepID=UPI001C9263FA|nr:ras-related protein Rab-23-like [Amphibalanus amphitrite]
MRDDEMEVAVKVVIVGNGAVGKSSMIQRYCRGTFTREYKKTIGVDFLERMLEVYDDPVRLMLWDTAGQEEFDAITKAYYRGAQACVLTFSTVDRASFQAVRHWKKKVEDECGTIPMVLVQNKIDLIDRAAIDAEEAEALARELKVRLYRCSVKEDLNVSQVFTYLAERYLAELRSWEEEEFEPPRPVITTSLFSASGYKFPGKRSPYDSGIISLHPSGRRRHRRRRVIWKNICIT